VNQQPEESAAIGPRGFLPAFDYQERAMAYRAGDSSDSGHGKASWDRGAREGRPV